MSKCFTGAVCSSVFFLCLNELNKRTFFLFNKLSYCLYVADPAACSSSENSLFIQEKNTYFWVAFSVGFIQWVCINHLINIVNVKSLIQNYIAPLSLALTPYRAWALLTLKSSLLTSVSLSTVHFLGSGTVGRGLLMHKHKHRCSTWTWRIIMHITQACIINKSRNARGPSTANTSGLKETEEERVRPKIHFTQ